MSKGGDNIRMNTLITSSPTTLKWLNSIKSKIEGKVPSLKYGEKKFWATFKSPEKNRNVVMLQPQKSQIRLFTKLEICSNSSLEPAPTSREWKETYPSIYFIRSEDTIDKAVELIISSYKKDSLGGSYKHFSRGK